MELGIFNSVFIILTWSVVFSTQYSLFFILRVWKDCAYYASYTTICCCGALDCVQLNKNLFSDFD